MLVVINGTYGGWMLPQEVVDMFGCDRWEDSWAIRTSGRLVDWVLGHPDDTDLVVVEVPDDFTDKMIDEYDGAETLYYVLDGKIRRAHRFVED